jgi:hypothetical protein
MMGADESDMRSNQPITAGQQSGEAHLLGRLPEDDKGWIVNCQSWAGRPI